MKKILLLSTLTLMTLLYWKQEALATPTLQLDILGGTYDTATGTIVSNGDVFTLYAYLITNSFNPVTDNYFISAALTPQVTEQFQGNYGSFSFAGSTIQVTADMIYGRPPADEAYPPLGPHGIYDTYYKEILFQFDTANEVAPTNSQDMPGASLVAGTGMYYAAFLVDTSLLAPGYELHFDLYNENVRNTREYTQFAPYSHDAESNGGTPVPEPAGLLLFGTGLAGLVGSQVRRRKNV